MTGQKAIIIGAGPAGLTAAYELVSRTDITPIVIEASEEMGGLSRTVNYKGNRIDIGGHRFFSKSDRVMDWWADILPIQGGFEGEQQLTYQQNRHMIQTSDGPDPLHEDRVMLLRQRKSRIYYLRKFFDYPISLSTRTIINLGFIRTVHIILSYLKAMCFPIRPERNLEEFFINRFGKALYLTFFKSYTEKVWGVPCRQIGADWGAQRIKGLNILKILSHSLSRLIPNKRGFRQKTTETSLIEQFLYPKFGPGQMWEEVAKKVRQREGVIHTNARVLGLKREGARVVGVEIEWTETGEREFLEADYVISTMPIRDLVRSMSPQLPSRIVELSEGLVYRDFMVIGLLLEQIRLSEPDGEARRLIRDNWIYIQEPGVLMGRLQVFNNWSPYLVANPETVWLGLEYFCNETDDLWNRSDFDLIQLAGRELEQMSIADQSQVLDGTVIRVPKAYPAYFGSYPQFGVLRDYLDRIENLFLIGRNGMHRYNNQDHSMLTAMAAVDNIISGSVEKQNIWSINAEQDYHETASKPSPDLPSNSNALNNA